MASFEQHVNTAVIATGVLIVPFHTSGIVNTQQSIALLALGLLGGILPDLDSDNSKPVQAVFRILSIFIPLLVLLVIGDNLSVISLIIFWLGTSALLHLTLFKLFLKLTVHRGIFHTIPMGLVMGELTSVLLYYQLQLPLYFSVLSGLFLCFGFFIHLLLDEAISLNALGLHTKKSLGTAFKLYSKNNIFGSVILYILLIGLFLMLPYNAYSYQSILDVFNSIRI